MLELTAGGTAVKDVMRILNTANSTGQDNVQQWLESVSKIKKDYTEGLKNYEMSALRNQNSSLKDAFALASCVAVSEFPQVARKLASFSTFTDDYPKQRILQIWIESFVNIAKTSSRGEISQRKSTLRTSPLLLN